VTTVNDLPHSRVKTLHLSCDLTRRCQSECGHCYNQSGPQGDHGTMTREDWTRVLTDAAEFGFTSVQFIGGEVTLHPDLPALVDHALSLGLPVEVFSNLIHITSDMWSVFQKKGVLLATSYYSHNAASHDAMTRRGGSHTKTRKNIVKALALGIPMRVGIITPDGEDGEAARAEIEALGVQNTKIDRVRGFGRGARDAEPCMTELCGKCGTTQVAVDPNGDVSPCVMSHWLRAGNVKALGLAAIVNGPSMDQLKAEIRDAVRVDLCASTDDTECSPGTPLSDCSPRR
jgi:MoaA/NifB/PqqE/SkfB family radical SAM enzyme